MKINYLDKREDNLAMDEYEAINHIFEGEALLFVGAGFSMDTPNANGSKIPVTSELSKKLQLDLDPTEKIDYETNIQQISEYYLDEKGKSQLINLLKKEFEVTDTIKFQDTITKQNWRRIYTTNYDNVLETSSAKNGIHRYPVSVNKENKNPKNEERKQIIHINGFVDNINSDNILTDIKLTNSSYVENNFLDSRWQTEFDIDLEHSKAIFFIGFSLNYDLDLSRFISQNKNLKEKTYFINGNQKNKFGLNNLKKFGNVKNMSAEDFAEVLVEQQKNYIPSSTNKGVLHSFELITPQTTNQEIMADDVTTMFFSGNIDKDKLYTYADEKGKYLVKRSNIETILELIEKKQLIVCHSEFGNGKTFFLKSLESIAVKNGYLTYSYNGNPNEIEQDITILNNLDVRKAIITIDDYYRLDSEFKQFIKLDKDKFTVIVTGRTAINYNMLPKLIHSGGFSESETTSRNINLLEESDIDQIYDLMEYHNIWGEKAALSKEKKNKLLKKSANKQFKNIMFNIFKSQDMFTKLFKLYSDLNQDLKELIIVSLINNILSSGLKYNQMLILSDKIDLSNKLSNNVNFKEFIDHDNAKVILNSSIASQEILKQENDKKLIINTMEKLIKKADKVDVGLTYNYLKKELVSFSNFKLLFRGTHPDIVNDLAIIYFGKISNTPFANKNPFFWLQYAIQKLEQEDYEMAEIYFDNAYSYAKSNGMDDFFQIYAQKARLLIEKSFKQGQEIEQIFSNFQEAHILLTKELNHPMNKVGYQLKQAAQYEKIYNKFYDKFEPGQQVILIEIFKEMFNHIDMYMIKMDKNNSKIDYQILVASNSIEKILKKNNILIK